MRYRVWLLLLALMMIGRAVDRPASVQADHGQVIDADNFDDPARGIMPRASSNAQTRLGYVAGEYQIAITDPNLESIAWIGNRQEYTNVAMAFDVRLIGPTARRYAVIGCRSTDAGHYRFSMDPDAGSYTFTLIEPSRTTTLRSGSSPAIRRGNASNRMEFVCAGTTLTAIINGVVVATVQDSRYGQGTSYFGVGAYAGLRLTADARLDNWVITDPATPRAPVATPAAPTPTAPAAGAHRLTGVLSVAGETAPANVTVTALIGDTVCGTARTAANGGFAVAVLAASSRSGCGSTDSMIRIGVRPAFGQGWVVEPNIPFQAGGSTTRNISVDLRRLPAAAGNVPWTRENWDWPFGLPVGICDDLSDSGRGASAAGLAMWITAYRSQGLGIELLADGALGCDPHVPGIVIIAANIDEPDAIAGTLFLDANLNPCDPDEGCTAFKALIAINPPVFNRMNARDQAATIAHELGHALGLDHAHTCNGGTIMWEDTSCRFPRTHIGVDDIASLNERYGAGVEAAGGLMKRADGEFDSPVITGSDIDADAMAGPTFALPSGATPAHIFRQREPQPRSEWSAGAAFAADGQTEARMLAR